MTPPDSPPGAASTLCAGCGLEVAQRLLACPRCRRLVHGAALTQLAAEAERAAAAGEVETALSAWRRALLLLPPDSQQHAQITARIADLGRAVEGAPGATSTSARPGRRRGPLVGLGIAGAALWKLKVVILFVLTKVKFLLLGFTKIGTVLSALASFGLYWSLWGWRFALGFVASIYVHEMGHVAALRRYGIPATAPMFIPGLGAFVRLKQSPSNVTEDARIALGGPIWGLGAAIAAWAIGRVSNSAFWMSLAHASALINLFNLIPLGSLDGGRAFRALDRRQRWLMGAVLAAMMVLSGERLIILLAIAAAFRAWSPPRPDARDRGAFLLFVAVSAALALVGHLSAGTGVAAVAGGALPDS